MDISERIAMLRKEKGISQEQLANEMGISRQAVSKWESELSIPDLNNIISISEYFNVSTDYLLKGTKEEKNSNAITSKVLYVSSTFAIVLGLLVTLGGWDSAKAFEGLAVGMLIQAVGFAAYFIGKSLSKEKAHIGVMFLNILLVLYLPVTSIIGFGFNGVIAPYPTDTTTFITLVLIYAVMAAIVYFILRKMNKNK